MSHNKVKKLSQKISSLNIDNKWWDKYVEKITPLIKKEWNKPTNKRPTNDVDILDNNNKKDKKLLDIAHTIKQRKMKYGKIHQIAIGNFPGWIDIGNKHNSGCDLLKKDNTVIIELKNKWNTCNSDSSKTLKDKLSKYKKNNNKTICIWGIINAKPNIKHSKKMIKHHKQDIIQWQGEDFLSFVYTYNNIDYSKKVIKLIKSIIH